MKDFNKELQQRIHEVMGHPLRDGGVHVIRMMWSGFVWIIQRKGFATSARFVAPKPDIRDTPNIKGKMTLE